MKTKWNLGLLYKNENDPQIEKDIIAVERAYAAFEKKYKNTDFTATVKKLRIALDEYALLSDMNSAKSWWYFALRTDSNSDDSIAGAAATRINQRLNTSRNKLTFFNLTLAKIPLDKQKIYLLNPLLSSYTYMLQQIFDQARFNLSESEEQLANLLSQTSYDMWYDGQQKNLTQQTVEHNGKQIPISEAFSIISDLPKRERHELYQKSTECLQKNAPFAEAEINAIYNYKKIMDERRGYKKPYSATLYQNQNDEKSIEGLIAMVTKNFAISQRFYALHAKLLNEKSLTVADMSVKIGKINKSFDFAATTDIVRKAFARVGEKHVAVLDRFLANGQIDVFPRKGKRAGGYCWGMGTMPTYILLNHTDDIRSVETLAHEMGHAIHRESIKHLPAHYRGYSTATAEVASTFFEQLVTEELEKTLSEEEKIIVLHNKLLGDMGTIFRQVACFNFELELHNTVRKEGMVDQGKMATLLQQHLQAYLGKTVVTTKDDGYRFVNWPHLRYYFYVYTYAYGQLISRALYEKWKAHPQYMTKIEQFLAAGQTMSPKDIFKSIGITTNEAFFEAGLKGIEADIDRLEKLSKNWLKKQRQTKSPL